MKKSAGVALLAGVGLMVAGKSVPGLGPVGMVVATSGLAAGMGSCAVSHCVSSHRDNQHWAYERNYHDAQSYRDHIHYTLRPRIEATRLALSQDSSRAG